MYAIKGTTAAMRCLGYKYELGKTHKTRKYPILCQQGFHACLNPYEVLCYYENDGKNRYFLVDLGGTITDCDGSDTKVAANEITFLKEVTVADFPALFEEFIKNKERLAKLDYVEGFSQVYKDGKFNFINKDGKLISKDWFDSAWGFFEGFAVVRKNRKYNYIDHDGKLISKKWFDEAWWFSNGFAKVKKGCKWYKLYPDGHLEYAE